MASTYKHRRSRVRANEATPIMATSRSAQHDHQVPPIVNERTLAYDVHSVGDWSNGQLIMQHDPVEDGYGVSLDICLCKRGDCQCRDTSMTQAEGLYPSRVQLPSLDRYYLEHSAVQHTRADQSVVYDTAHVVPVPRPATYNKPQARPRQKAGGPYATMSEPLAINNGAGHKQAVDQYPAQTSIAAWVKHPDSSWSVYNTVSDGDTGGHVQ